MTMAPKKIDLGGTARSPEDVTSLFDLGLRFAEIPISNPSKFLPLVPVYESLRNKLGLYYLCHGPKEGDPNDVDTLNQVYVPKVFELFPIMKSLSMRVLTIHLWLDQRFVKKRTLESKLDILRKVVERAADDAILVCIENLSEEVKDMEPAFREIPSLRMTLDLGHGELLCEKNRSMGFIEKVPERIQHIHLHDNRGGTSHTDDLHLPPGQGVIDFKGLFEALHRIRYDRTVTLELKPHEIRQCLTYVSELVSGPSHVVSSR
jgi:sugar phosphate isomerase/epimerase